MMQIYTYIGQRPNQQGISYIVLVLVDDVGQGRQDGVK